MPSLSISQRQLMLLCSLATVAMSGCPGENELESATAKRLQAAAIAYLDFLAATGKGPANAAQLQAHSQRLVVTAEPLSEVSASLISERDGEPLVVRYGLLIHDFSNVAAIPIAFERKGHNQRRLVAYLDGSVKCLNESECREQGLSP